METNYEVLTKFRVGDMVRIKHDLTFFDRTVQGVAMKVTEVARVDVDGSEAVQYRTDRADPIHGAFFNEDELVAA